MFITTLIPLLSNKETNNRKPKEKTQTPLPKMFANFPPKLQSPKSYTTVKVMTIP